MNNEKTNANTGFANYAREVADLCGVPEMERLMEEERRATQMMRALASERVRRNLSQGEVARRMGVTQVTVSRIENRRDEDMSLGDLFKYASAIGVNVSVMFDPDAGRNEAAVIKHCVHTIAGHLKTLSEIARSHADDQSLFDGITRFQGEVLYNFLLRYDESAVHPIVLDSSRPLGNTGEPESQFETPSAAEPVAEAVVQ